MAKKNKDWLTSGEMARYCMVSRDTVKRWVRDGLLASVITPGGRNRIPRKVAVRFLRDHNMPVPEALAGEDAIRVLVVDDEKAVRDLLKKIFDRASDQYVLEVASSGIEGCMKIGSFRPHLLILDLMMPDIDGFKVIEEVRGNPVTRDTKILFYSGYLTEERIEEAKELGADECISKPFDPKRFWATISEMLSGVTGEPVQPVVPRSPETQAQG